MTTKDTDTHNPVPATEPLALRLSEGLGPNVQEDGPWEFGYDVTKGKAYVDSQDFHYDARLHISGDFGGTDEALAYAKEIARRLNDAPEIARLRAALELAAPALELGCDALLAEAQRYHAEMAGYRLWKHQQVDDDYKRADLAWQAVVAALGPNVRAERPQTAAPQPE